MCHEVSFFSHSFLYVSGGYFFTFFACRPCRLSKNGSHFKVQDGCCISNVGVIITTNDMHVMGKLATTDFLVSWCLECCKEFIQNEY